jgi:hypothetical protein
MEHKIFKVSFGAIVLFCIAFCLISINSINAQDQDNRDGGLCSRVGTWQGVSDLGFTWMAVKSPGRNAINGQLTLEWSYFDPTLFGNFADAIRITNAYGVWKKVGHDLYQFTWMAYGINQNGGVVYTMRASGEAESVDCDNADITYMLKVWVGVYDISEDEDPYPPDSVVTIPGTASEKRMPLVQASFQ